jgi:hypothetical protein
MVWTLRATPSKLRIPIRFLFRRFAPAIKRLKLTQGYDAFCVSPFTTYPQRHSA